jgi:hypothetical protein
MNRYCLVCTPRSGSYYILFHLSKERNLISGKEWYGRMKNVHYNSTLQTSKLTIDYTLNENLLTNHEIEKRRMWLEGRDNFIIKCMPIQLSNTIENKNMTITERMEIAVDILSDYEIIWLTNRNKVSQFCFRFIAQETSRPDYEGKNREYSDYDPANRKITPPKSFTATREEYERFMQIENFNNNLRKHFPACEEIIYEDFIKDRDIIPNPDYTKIFTNYKEILSWFH